MPHDHRPPAAPRRGAQPRRHPVRPPARLPAVRARPPRWPSGSPPHLAGPGRRAAARRRRTSSPRRSSARRRRPRPSPRAFGLEVGTRRAVHRGREPLRGPDVRRGRRLAAPPARTGGTCGTRSGRPGASRTGSRSPACWPASSAARRRGQGHEAVVVSHQLPIWVTRSALEGRRLWHDPRRRECSLASLTTLDFDGDRLVAVTLQRAGRRPPARRAGRCRGPDGSGHGPRRSLQGGARRSRAARGRRRAPPRSRAAGPTRRRPDGLRVGRRVRDDVGRPATEPVPSSSPARTSRATRSTSRTGGATSSCSTPGTRAARRAARRRPTSSRSRASTRTAGVHVLGINSTDDAGAAQAFERTFELPYPCVHDTDGSAVAALQGIVPSRPCRRRSSWTGRGGWPPASSGSSTPRTLRALVDDLLGESGNGGRRSVGRRRARPPAAAPVPMTVARADRARRHRPADSARRLDAARRAGRGGRRGSCPSPRRACCPLVPGYLGYVSGMAGRRRPRRRRGARSGRRRGALGCRVAPRPAARRGRRCSSPVSRWCSWCSACWPAPWAGPCCGWRDVITRVLGVVVVAHGARVRGLAAVRPARAARAPRTDGGAVGCAAAGRGVRPGLGAVHRPDARRGVHAGAGPGVGRAGRGAVRGVLPGPGLPFLLIALVLRALARGRWRSCASTGSPSCGSGAVCWCVVGLALVTGLWARGREPCRASSAASSRWSDGAPVPSGRPRRRRLRARRRRTPPRRRGSRGSASSARCAGRGGS